jgi:hypothetical protein
MNFRFPVGLYFGTARQGQITFHNFLVKKPSDFTCEPEGLLLYDEAKSLLRQIRQAPLSVAGEIGKFAWQV